MRIPTLVNLSNQVVSSPVGPDTETLLLAFTFEDRLADGESIASVAHTITPAGNTVVNESFDSTGTNVTIGVGTTAGVFTVESRVVTSFNNTMQSYGLFVVQ